MADPAPVPFSNVRRFNDISSLVFETIPTAGSNAASCSTPPRMSTASSKRCALKHKMPVLFDTGAEVFEMKEGSL